jgi:hypothetical protein
VKPLALVLLVANILAAGYFLFADFRAASEGDPSREQINADSIRVVATGSRVGALMRPQTADAGPDAPRSCASWGVFPEGQIAAVEARLSALDLGARLSRGDGGASSYIVLILPIPRRADLNRRVEELVRSGVTDQFVINDGEYRGGVSLGYFKTEDAANRHLNALKAKGVSDAVVRPRLSGGRPATLLMRDLSTAERARIEAIAADFPGVELRMQPCPAANSG